MVSLLQKSLGEVNILHPQQTGFRIELMSVALIGNLLLRVGKGRV